MSRKAQASKQGELAGGIALGEFFLEEADSAVIAVVAGDDLDRPSPHPFDPLAYAVELEAAQLRGLDFGQDLVFVAELPDQPEVDIPNTLALGRLLDRLGDDFIEGDEVFKRDPDGGLRPSSRSELLHTVQDSYGQLLAALGQRSLRSSDSLGEKTTPHLRWPS
jgi:hypothetical protein